MQEGTARVISGQGMKGHDALNIYGMSGPGTYDGFMGSYFTHLDESTQKTYVDFFSRLGIKPNQRVLEVGIGTGLNLPLYPRGIKLIGIDPTPEMLEKARVKCRELNREDIETLNQDGRHIPYEDNYFDTVVETFMLCVAEHPEEVFDEMIRVCKPDGTIGIFDYKQATSNPRVLKDQMLLAETMRRKGIYHNGVPAVVFDPLFDLDSLVQNSGLAIQDEIRIESSFIESLGMYLLKK